MVGTTDQLTAAIPGSNDNRVTICSTVSCFGPEVITSARTVVRSVPSMSSLRIGGWLLPEQPRKLGHRGLPDAPVSDPPTSCVYWQLLNFIEATRVLQSKLAVAV